ncbi:hypothetical protein SRABI118_03791 [Massilia sp. Bi118]|uniref:hypothetical protein n=1 Tax=Massilia sp. Bi118 TaxID=2822346 RepID=UPI001D1CB170|nr:hypothetical protein [Massilia sp. Bi118]CAH0281450.1 hypothetical protein SRABI118_03791 [Massilia sp. Bi118]
MSDSSYRISAQPRRLGGGWKLVLYEQGAEIGGAAFTAPPVSTAEAGAWWEGLGERQRQAFISRYGPDPRIPYRMHLEIRAYLAGIQSAGLWLNSERDRSYDILPLPEADGEGWLLLLLEDGAEIDCLRFCSQPGDPSEIDAWWTALTAAEQLHWLAIAGTKDRADAHAMCMLTKAFANAGEAGAEWIERRT